MHGAGKYQIGIVADQQSVSELLRVELRLQGFSIAYQAHPDAVAPGDMLNENIQAWLVCVSEGYDLSPGFEAILPHIRSALVIDEYVKSRNSKAEQKWLQRVVTTLEKAIVDEALQLELSQVEETKAGNLTPVELGAKQLWVLGASAGGPEAVIQFMTNISRTLPIALVYAQHIDAASAELLVRVMRKCSAFDVKLIHPGDVLQHGQLGIVPLEQAVELQSGGQVAAVKGGWRAPYSPDITKVMQDVAKHYRHRAGAVVFSGMGQDGAEGAKAIKQEGGELWVQAPNTCIIDSMPQAALDAAQADLVAAPKQLAQAFMAKYGGIAA